MKTVTYLPREAAERITQPTNMISIGFAWDRDAVFAVEHNRLLRLRFIDELPPSPDKEEGYITLSLLNSIISFIENCNGEDIVVHCGEGQVRSTAIALFIERAFEYEIDFQAKGCTGSTAMASRRLNQALRARYKARQDKGNVH